MNQAVLNSIALRMVTAYLLKGDKAAVLVDTGMSGSEKTILDAMERAGVAPGELALVIITHGHTDHFGSAAAIREHTGAKLAVHRADAPNLRRGNNGVLKPRGFWGRLLKLLVDPDRFAVSGVEPDILLDDEFDLTPYGIRGKVVPTPGHTAGSVSIILEAGDVIAGDMVTGLLPGRPVLPPYAEDERQLLDSIASMIKSASRLIYVGHGGPFEPGTLRSRFRL